jgi:hypothetical protein
MIVDALVKKKYYNIAGISTVFKTTRPEKNRY